VCKLKQLPRADLLFTHTPRRPCCVSPAFDLFRKAQLAQAKEDNTESELTPQSLLRKWSALSAAEHDALVDRSDELMAAKCARAELLVDHLSARVAPEDVAALLPTATVRYGSSRHDVCVCWARRHSDVVFLC
jgi:hypothetical protein